MRLRHIEVFHAIYSSGSMTQAARLLNVSQPSISKVLSHAEAQLGFKLFQRVKGKLIPTPEAVRLYDYVARLYEELASVRRVSENLREAAEGKVRIACTPTLGLDLLPDAIAAFNAQHDGATFEIETLHYSEIASALAESRVDLGLAFDAPNQVGIASETLLEGRLVLIAPMDMALPKDGPVSLEQLAQQPFVRMHQRGPLGQVLEAHLRAIDIEFDEVAVSETYQIARSLVARGLGFAVVDNITAESASGGEVQIRALQPKLTFEVSLLKLENKPLSLLCQRFAQQLPLLLEKAGV